MAKRTPTIDLASAKAPIEWTAEHERRAPGASNVAKAIALAAELHDAQLAARHIETMATCVSAVSKKLWELALDLRVSASVADERINEVLSPIRSAVGAVTLQNPVVDEAARIINEALRPMRGASIDHTLAEMVAANLRRTAEALFESAERCREKAQTERGGSTGRLPDAGLRLLVRWHRANPIGWQALARHLVHAGIIDLTNDAGWRAEAREEATEAPMEGADLEDAVDRVAARLKTEDQDLEKVK